MRGGLEAIFAIFVATSFAAIRNRPVWFLPTVGACPVTANITNYHVITFLTGAFSARHAMPY
jgi:hypothetical protein